MQFAISYYYDSSQVVLYGNRLETDKELAFRLKSEEKARIAKQKLDAKKDAEELKLYKKLNIVCSSPCTKNISLILVLSWHSK